ncbi:MAG: 16S rRNA (uracil(1498)-N(3))-methyltransferase [Crocinitomicaceae bacterium]|nr:16S rRNA (uracil(1498)-N(3))-methyltransferase [Crocinitomicaceae bacterium]MDG1775942.1 16S rRNA (uracil(1498)-N(3))-methyltransferase [Crocinitomicaceae bacterium]
MRLFYDPNISPQDLKHTLSEEESKHVVRVLRMKMGDCIGLLDGKGSLYVCEIILDNPKRCELTIKSVNTDDKETAEIHIAVGPTKQMERIEWFIEKATEIGITEITLIECKNSERIKIKTDRLEKKAVSAMKQSHRTFLPKINALTKVTDFIKKNPNGLIAHCFDEKRAHFKDVFTSTNCPVLIGPEGDFTLEEIKLAKEYGYKTITLGENRLRTETAALFTCMQAKLLIQ